MAAVVAPPSQGFQTQLGSRWKVQSHAGAEAGFSWQSSLSSSNVSCGGSLKGKRSFVSGWGMGVFSKNLCQDSLRFMSCVSRSDIVPGPFFSQPAPLENMRFGKAFSAGFRRRTTRQNFADGARCPTLPLIRTSAARTEGQMSEAGPEKDDIWANSSLPAYFKKYARPPKEKFNWALVLGGVLFVVAARKLIMTEIMRWVLGSVAACGYIAQGAVIALDWIVDTYGQYLGIVLTLAGWVILALQDAYAFIIDMTPVRAVLSASAWVSAVLSVRDVASATAKESFGSYLFAGLWGLLAVLHMVPPSVFLFGLIFLAVLQRFVRKTDTVAAVTPMVAVLAAVGDPVVKMVAFVLFLALAVRSYYKFEGVRQDEAPTTRKQPLVLVLLMACVGISVAANALHAYQVKWITG